MAAVATSNVTYANNLNSAAPTITSISYSTVTTNGNITTNKTVKITCDDNNDGVIDRDGDNIKYTTYTTITTTDSSTTPPTKGTPQPSRTTSTTPTTVVLGRDAKSCSITMSDGTKITQTSRAYRSGASLPVTTTTTIYDTLGNAHSVVLYFTKTSIDSVKGNTWTVSVNTDGTGTNQILETDGTLTTVTMTDAQLNFTTSGGYNSGSPTTTTLTLTNGANGTQEVTIDLSSLTQYSGNSTINATNDGNAAGTLSSISIDSSGVITGTYTNGLRQSEAQVAIAQFTNASGLTKTGNSLYQESNNSGTPNVKTAGDLGVTITPSALEMSNVDVANEFADMIITQRGFQSNSKIVTVGDEMLETVINMKR
jgi:flagellar hook protein FlgE